MPQLKQRPSSLLDAAPRSRRESRYALLEDVDVRDRRRSIGVGIILTIGVWCLCLFLFNLLITHLDHQHNSNATAGATAHKKPTFDIEIQPEEFLMPKKPVPPPQNFVETNPDAPENIPDNTNNFAAQNQQAAQEKPDPAGKSDRAATEGKKDWDSNQIVSGRLAQPQIDIPPAPPPAPEMKESAAVTEATPAAREQNPLSGEQKIQGDSPTGFATGAIKLPDNAKNVSPDVTEPVKGLADAPYVINLPPQAVQPKIDPRHPQPRQRIAQNVRPAILADNKVGTRNVGLSGIDAKWSNYGQYLQKLIDTVQIQFDDLNERSKVWPPSGTKITVKFRLNSLGEISEIIEADGNGGTQATQICVTSITDRAPYGKWTDDMLAMLGESQVLTFTFYYGTP